MCRINGMLHDGASLLSSALFIACAARFPKAGTRLLALSNTAGEFCVFFPVGVVLVLYPTVVRGDLPSGLD